MVWIPTRSGKALDLVEPKAAEIDIENDVAVSLSLIPRFNGHAGLPQHGFSVAQHSILGARAILAEWDDTEAALAFLLHDAHEFAIGDMTTPVVQALDRLAWPRDAGTVSTALETMKFRFDAVIYKRLGLAYPIPLRLSGIVRDMDTRMLRRELDELLPASPRRFNRHVENAAPIPSLTWRDFLPMTADHLTAEWLRLLAAWMPHPIPQVAA